MRGNKTDEERVKILLAQLDEKLNAYDKVLSKQKYLAGDEITLADLYHIPYGCMVGQAGFDIMKNKPNVARYVVFFFFYSLLWGKVRA